jgi:fucose 4-O-acetylase-like acetyltransferase
MPVNSASHRQDRDSPSRIEWVDVAKGLGIFLVVFGHTLGGLRDSPILGNTKWLQFSIDYIYTFHMPLFFFLAGLFVARSACRSFYEYFLDKASVIVYPYFMWSIIEGTLQIFSARFTNNQVSSYRLLEIVYSPIDQFWFLYVIFMMYIIYWWIIYWHISNTSFLIFAIFIYVIEAIEFNVIEWSVLHSLFSLTIYFALGARARETAWFRASPKVSGRPLLGMAIIGYVSVAAAVAVDLSRSPLIHPLFAGFGIMATIALAMALSITRLSPFVRTIGVYSLEIYVAHTMFSAAVRIVMTHLFHYSGTFLYIVLGTAVGICLPIALAVLGPKVGLPYLFTWNRSRQKLEVEEIKRFSA